MAAQALTSAFSPSPPPLEVGGIYLGAGSRTRSYSPHSPPSETSSHGSQSPSSINTIPYHRHYHHHYQQQLQGFPPTVHNRYGPLPPPQNLTLPPIDVLAMSTIISPSPMTGETPGAPRMSMTSREWVIPPRPKPGRKPATDTPPTKRKAQNRAAQRAFRERRAARVGELEEQLDQQKECYDKDEQDMKDRIRSLELELESFRSKCTLLEDMLEKERKERIRAESEAETLKRRQEDGFFRHGGMGSHSDQWRGMQQSHFGRSSQHHDPFSLLDSDVSAATLPCGKCSPGACVCANEALASTQAMDLKRPSSPSGLTSDEKRHRANMLTDFTHQPQQLLGSINTPSHEDLMKDNCGFCKDGTYCVCADAAMATPAMTPTTDILPPIQHPIIIHAQTPPPSEPDTMPMVMEMTAEGAVKLPRRKPQPVAKPSGGCGVNGPGSCAQCQADPKSGLFCRLMAAKLDRDQGGSGGGCCGGQGAGGGCCKARPQQPEKITLPSLPSLGLSCAEAYQTLSSHRNFDRASDDIGSWLPKLKAAPNGNVGPNGLPKIMPIEVEAASIMSVLKVFDVRFGGT